MLLPEQHLRPFYQFAIANCANAGWGALRAAVAVGPGFGGGTQVVLAVGEGHNVGTLTHEVSNGGHFV